MNPVIVFTDEPNGCCPVQAEGTIDGFPFYFRSRWSTSLIRVALKRDADPLVNYAWAHKEEYPEGGVSGHGCASKEECVEFINKCAKLWAERKVEEKP